jgi:methionyl-tRNA formyltransferase
MKVVFFGSGNRALSVIDTLKKEFDVTVFTTEKEKEHELIKYCAQNNLPCISFSSFSSDIKEKLAEIKADFGFVASFRLILPRDILDLFPKGVLNAHPSLLPKYRGATPGQSAILNGDKTTGVSIIKLDEKMDHGPILWQKEEEIQKDDTGNSLYERLFKLAADSLLEVTNSYLKGSLTSVEQDDKEATFVSKLNRDSGYIDPKNPPKPEALERMIRAYFRWPGVWTKINLDSKGEKIIKLLPENMLQVEGKNPMTLKDFKNGYPLSYNKITRILG